MIKTVHGIVNGKTIELDEELGVASGQAVEVQVRVIAGKKALPGPPPGWRQGSTKSLAGALADLCTPEEDRILDEIYRDRKRERRQEALE